MTLLVNYIDEVTIEEYIEASHMDQDGAWGTTAEMLVLAHILEANIASYNSDDKRYQVYSLGVIDYEVYGEDNSWPTPYDIFTDSNHLNVMLSQE